MIHTHMHYGKVPRFSGKHWQCTGGLVLPAALDLLPKDDPVFLLEKDAWVVAGAGVGVKLS